MPNTLPQLSPDNWYIIATVDEVNPGPVAKKLFNQDLVLFKDLNGKISILEDYCLHRGYPLSEGRVIKGELQCPYHGWCFNAKGECTRIPGNQEQHVYKFKSKPLNHKVLDGFIWVSLNPDNPFQGPPYLLKNTNEVRLNYVVDANHYLIVENTLDPFHTSFVHTGLVRGANHKIKRNKIKIALTQTNSSVEAHYLNEGKQSGIISSLFSSNEDQSFGRYIHPGILQLEYKDHKKTKLMVTSFLTPRDETSTEAFVRIQYPSFPLRADILFKPFVMMMLKTVIKQDQRVCEAQQKNLLNHQKDHFVSTPLDYMHQHLRAIIKSNGEAEPLERTFDIYL